MTVSVDKERMSYGQLLVHCYPLLSLQSCGRTPPPTPPPSQHQQWQQEQQGQQQQHRLQEHMRLPCLTSEQLVWPGYVEHDEGNGVLLSLDCSRGINK